MWVVAAALGTGAVLSGLLAPAEALAVLARTAPVLCTATTVALSLDTTAVLLTPVVLALASRLGLPPLPFAMASVWLANTASLALPVSNLTNLLALRTLGLSPAGYARAMALPAAVAVIVTVIVLVLWQRRALTGRYVIPDVLRPDDRALFSVAALACLLLVPALAVGVPVPWAAAGAAALAGMAAAVRRPRLLCFSLVPWRLVVLVVGLFLVVEALGPRGLDAALSSVADGHGRLAAAAVAAGAANGVNTLPAYLALERAVPEQDLFAVLLGVDLGPLITPWGSLATCCGLSLDPPW